jgi:glutamine amidotransferase
MLFDDSEEAPGVAGLGLLPGTVSRLVVPGQPLPHMGWNTLAITPGSQALAGLGADPYVYFVHSYAPVPANDAVIAATTDYGGPIVAAVEQGPLWATQFHPEKSGANGLAVLANFVRACGYEVRSPGDTPDPGFQTHSTVAR